MLQSVASSRCVRLIDRNRPAWYFGFLMVSYILYLIFGAVVFSSVELPYEDLLRRDLQEIKRQFISDNECMSEENLERFLEQVLEANNYGVSILNNASGNWNWDFMSSLFFASTVLSTTGYGHTVPLSDGGKTFCILYSVVGIPFTLLLFTALVQRIIIFVTRRPVLYIHLHWGYPKHIVAIVHALLLGFLTVTCFFIIPAAVFSILEEDWNFLESFYFCFISLSTIGLGDYVPGEGYNQKFRQLYKMGITSCCLENAVIWGIKLKSNVPNMDALESVGVTKRKVIKCIPMPFSQWERLGVKTSSALTRRAMCLFPMPLSQLEKVNGICYQVPVKQLTMAWQGY